MKYLILVFVLTPIFTQAQFEYLKFEKEQIYFEKVYQIDSLNSEGIKNLLIKSIPSINDVTAIDKYPEIISAKISTLIDYKKFGGKWGKTAVFMNHPFCGNVSIIWKDRKYKVTVSNMYFNVTGFGIMKCNNIFTKKKGSELNTKKMAIESGKYIEKYLAELFTIKKDNNDW